VRQRKWKSSRFISNMDVSALAAVMFVLVFGLTFMTATPHYGVSADLPRVGHPIAMRGAIREDALIVTILRDGSVYFGKDRTRPADLSKRILEGVRGRAETKIYIRAYARLRYQTVREVLDAGRSAGLEKIVFLAEQRQDVSLDNNLSQ
jgi:biopolymer transport protein ExbD